MQVKISSTNLVSNMNSYPWNLTREYLDASIPQRKTKALPENFKKSSFGSPGANIFSEFSIKT
jgi:hypothetical protein